MRSSVAIDSAAAAFMRKRLEAVGREAFLSFRL